MNNDKPASESVAALSEELTTESERRLNELAIALQLDFSRPSSVALAWRKCFDWLAPKVSKQAELIAEIKNYKRMEPGWKQLGIRNLELQSENAKQVTELEQLRSERDKLRTERVEMRDLLEKINEGECVYIENGQMFQDVSEMIAKLRGAN